jgi:protein-S-isoprenylcysteine O-methyltransferase Ste14
LIGPFLTSSPLPDRRYEEGDRIRAGLLLASLPVGLVIAFLLRGSDGYLFPAMFTRFVVLQVSAGAWILGMLWQDKLRTGGKQLTSTFPYTVARNPFDLLHVLYFFFLAALTNRFEVMFILSMVYLAAIHLIVAPSEDDKLKEQVGEDYFVKVKRWGLY